MTDDAAVNASGLAMDKRPLIVAVDFDGTIVEHDYPRIGDPVPHALDVLRQFQEEGIRIILWTMRSHETLKGAVQYLEGEGIELWGVNENPEQAEWTESPKAFAHFYIDDAALGCPLRPGRQGDRPMVDWPSLIPYLARVGRLGQASPKAMKELTPTDAVYGFVADISTRPGTLMVGAEHDSSLLADLIERFCERNNLPSVSDAFPENLVPLAAYKLEQVMGELEP